MSVTSLLCRVERRTGWPVFNDCHSSSRFCQRPSPKGMEQTAAEQELKVPLWCACVDLEKRSCRVLNAEL